MEKSDEFDEYMLNCQRILHLENLSIAYFTVIIYQLGFVRICHVMSGHGIMKYFRPITHKKDAPEDKDPPEGKGLSNQYWPYLSKVIPPSSSLATCIMPADITRVLKQAKRSFT